MGLTNNTGKLSNTLTSNGTQITLGGSTVTDGNLLNIIGNQSSVNVGVVFNNTNGTYPKIYGLTNVNNNFVLYDYSSSATRLTISTTGAATFSSSVSTGGPINITVPYSAGTMTFLTQDNLGNGIYLAPRSILNFDYGVAGNTNGYINFSGYQNGTSYFRSLGIGNGKNGTIAFFDGTTSNVGIGTSSPQSYPNYTILHVAGTATNGSGLLYLTNSNNSIVGLAYAEGTNSNVTFGSQTNHPVRFVSNDTERMRITSGGDIEFNSGAVRANGGYFRIANSTGNTAYGYFLPKALWIGSGTDQSPSIAAEGGYGISFFTNGITDERMRITSGGNVEMYGNTLVKAASLTVGNNAAAGVTNITLQNNQNGYQFGINSACTLFQFLNGAPTVVATINGGSGAYTALSDVNKKKDFEVSGIGLNEVLQLKPTLFRFKDAEEYSQKELGFIAQEVKNIIPQAYTESGEGDDKFIGLQDRPIIAALVKAIQEQQAQIEELKALIAAK